MIPNNAVVIGIIGRAGTGKSTLATVFQECGLISMAFADPIKRLAAQLFEVPESSLWCASELKSDNARACMEAVGKAMRDIDESVWLRQLEKRVESAYMNLADPYRAYGLIAKKRLQGIVVTDVRYPQEAQALKKAYNAKLVRIERPGVQPIDPKYESDTAVDTIPDSLVDYLICNSGDLTDLKMMARAVFEECYGKNNPSPATA